MGEKRQCSERVYSGARHDLGGHRCTVNATVQDDDGNWWCRRHHPEVKLAKAAALSAKYQAERDAYDSARAEIFTLLRKLGVNGNPSSSVGAKFGAPPSGAHISTADLHSLVERLTKGEH